jgi:RNA polymerase sigma factor (sigma-70 family)
MEIESALPRKGSALSRQMRVISASKHGVDPGQMSLIGTDPELFELFYREHVEDLQRFIARRVGNPERAADLTADIFLAAIESAHRYQARQGSPKAWLYGIARFQVVDDMRDRGREQRSTERLRGRTLMDEDDVTRMDARIDAAARSRELYAAMDGLPESERGVLELVALDDLSVAEAAAVLGIRPVTARVRMHRARRKLRTALEASNGKSTIPTQEAER